MVCPYCSHKNSATVLICNQCGILLRLGRTSRLVPHGGGSKSFIRTLLPGNRLKSRHAALQARGDELVKEIQARAEADMQVPDRAAAARLGLGALHLIQGEIEKSIHWFQQARRMGGPEAEFLNNAGAALARRGTLPQATEMLEKAVRMGCQSAAPHASLAHLFVISGADPDPNGAMAAIGQIQTALRLEPKNPMLYNRLGLILCREGRCGEAALQFGQALKLSEGRSDAAADAYTNLGLAQALDGDLDAALTSFEAALEQDSGQAHALANLGIEQIVAGAVGLGLEKIQKAARIDPVSGAVRANHGYGLCRIGAINDGILELKEAISLDAHLFEAYYNLGKAYADGKALDVADRYLARALQISPRSGEALTAAGVVKTLQRLIPQAISLFQSALKSLPKNADAQLNLGVALGLGGDYFEALKHLRVASQLDPKNAAAPAQIGWVYLMQENLSTGLEELGVALKMDEHLPEVQNNYGICYISLGKPELAIPHFKRALELNPDFHAVHYQWGIALANQKLMDSAIREWDLTAKHEPNNADGHVNRGVALYQKNQIDDAIAAFRHVIVLRQTRMEDYSNLGLAYAKQGLLLKNAARNPQDPRMKQALDRHKQAIDMFDRAIAIDPKNVMLHSNRGLACFFAGQPEEAMKEWGLVSKLDPAYARRRGARVQSEYDDSQIALVPFSVPARAVPLPPRTGAYLPRYLAGYDTEDWELILSDPALSKLAETRREARRVERELAALHGGK